MQKATYSYRYGRNSEDRPHNPMENLSLNLGLGLGIGSGGSFGPDITTNGSLDDWSAGEPDDWDETTVGTGSIDEETVEVNTAGGSSAKITTGDTAAINIRQTIAVLASRNYRLRYYTRGDGTRDGRHRVFDLSNIGDIIANTFTGVTGTVWQLSTVDFITPAGCISLFISFSGNPTSSAEVYFDDISLKLRG